MARSAESFPAELRTRRLLEDTCQGHNFSGSRPLTHDHRLPFPCDSPSATKMCKLVPHRPLAWFWSRQGQQPGRTLAPLLDLHTWGKQKNPTSSAQPQADAQSTAACFTQRASSRDIYSRPQTCPAIARVGKLQWSVGVRRKLPCSIGHIAC